MARAFESLTACLSISWGAVMLTFMLIGSMATSSQSRLSPSYRVDIKALMILNGMRYLPMMLTIMDTTELTEIRINPNKRFILQ